MSITTVRGHFVDCHVCQTTKELPSGYAAHGYARFHAQSHQAPAPTFVQQSYVPAAPTAYKTGLNHTPHIVLDFLTCGGWLLVHIPLALLAGRKTKAIR